MNDDMPWVDLSAIEIEELRSKKQKLTEYGRQKLQEMKDRKTNVEIIIHQSNPNCLVYYTFKANGETIDGDALNIPAALQMINHHFDELGRN